MTTLRSLLVIPQFNGSTMTGATVTRYLDRDGYRSTLSSDIASLPAGTRAAFGVVVHHAQQLRAPDELISRVFGELGAPVSDVTHTETQDITDPETGATIQQSVIVVDSYRQQVSLSLTFNKLDGGERTFAVNTEQLSPAARDAVLALWAALTET